MMKISLCTFIFLSFLTVINAQFTCGTVGSSSADDIAPRYVSPCPFARDVLQGTHPVHINVNVHFFLDDNCRGNIATAPDVGGDLSSKNSFAIAKKLITDANKFFEKMGNNTLNKNNQWNQKENGATVTPALKFIPIRYVLNGVYLHCDSRAQSIRSGSFSIFKPYEKDIETTINVFVSNVRGSNNGYADGIPGKRFVVENFGPGLFNHEMGHVFNLHHTHAYYNDKCADTWSAPWVWDYNNDGIIDKKGRTCWSHTPIHENQNACTSFSVPHPCCSWTIQDNNLMTYSAWAGDPSSSALTPCQIRRMTENIDCEAL